VGTVDQVNEFKGIADPIHGSIRLTPLERNILQIPVLNRLHHIEQMSTAFLVFPGAHNSRFAHCVGTLHGGGLMISHLVDGLSNSTFGELFPGMKRRDVIQSTRLACLLHDLGHGPLSHISEDIMTRCLVEDHKSELSEAQKLLDCADINKLHVHEYYSHKLILESEVGQEIEKQSLSARAVASLLVKRKLRRTWTSEGHRILRRIVSSQIDADRMDYLLRDGYATGVPYGTVDIHRLISNLLIFKDKSGEFKLAIHERAQSTIEHILNARFMMYKWVYAHHVVVACDELMKQAMDRLIKLGDLELKLFHWKTFRDGLSCDPDIWHALGCRVGSHRLEMASFWGLLDRRYLPSSILKRPMEYTKLLQDIADESGTGDKDDAIERVRRFIETKSLRIRFQKKVHDLATQLEDALFLYVHKPRSPYDPLSKDDKVEIYSKHLDGLRNLSIVSPYFMAINEEWTNFPDVYFSYVIPGKLKRDSKAYSSRLRTALVEFVASES
jgi:HD superfamily phosphohydrolase